MIIAGTRSELEVCSWFILNIEGAATGDAVASCYSHLYSTMLLQFFISLVFKLIISSVLNAAGF